MSNDGVSRDLKSDLSLMQTIYGIVMTLAFRQLVESFYVYMSTDIDKRVSFWILTAFGVNLVLLGCRFFWSIGNIRRFVERTSEKLPKDRSRWVTVGYFPTLLTHGFMYYCLCKIHGDMLDPKLVDTRIDVFVRTYIGFLGANIAILRLLTRGNDSMIPESFWIKNNAFAVSVASIAYIWFRSDWIPATWMIIAVSFTFLLNSLIDLWSTAGDYIADGKPKPSSEPVAEQKGEAADDI